MTLGYPIEVVMVLGFKGQWSRSQGQQVQFFTLMNTFIRQLGRVYTRATCCRATCCPGVNTAFGRNKRQTEDRKYTAIEPINNVRSITQKRMIPKYSNLI